MSSSGELPTNLQLLHILVEILLRHCQKCGDATAFHELEVLHNMTQHDRKKIAMRRRFCMHTGVKLAQRHHLPLILLHPASKKPLKPWKSESATPEEAAEHARRGGNIAYRCGALGDGRSLIVVDFDSQEAYERLRSLLPSTLEVATSEKPDGWRGRHVYLFTYGRVRTRKIEQDGRELFSIRGEGAYIIAPGSRHPSGVRYEVIEDREIAEVDSGVFDRLILAARDEFKLKLSDRVDLREILQGVPEGGRDNAIVRLIHWLRRAGVDREKALRVCQRWDERNKPPLGSEYVKRKVEYHYSLAEPYGYVFVQDPKRFTLTDNLELRKKRSGRKRKKKASKSGEDEEEKPAVHTTFAEFPDFVIEQIAGGRFLKWRPGAGEWEIVSEVEVDGVIYRPEPPEAAAEAAVLLPEQPEEYGSVEELIEEVQEFIHRYVDVSETFEKFSAYYVLLTWVYDRLNTIPYLRVLGDWGVGKSRFLDVVGGLCYRATITAGAVTPAPVYRLLSKWRGTLIIEEADRRHSDETDEIVTILNCGFERGRPVIRCSKDNPDKLQVFEVYSPKILATRRRFKDVALESRCLTEVMTETSRDDIPVTLPECFREEQRKLRNKLLKFRLDSWHRINAEGFELPEELQSVEPRLRQATYGFAVLLHSLGESSWEDFVKFVKQLQREVVEERQQTTEGLVVCALFDLLDVSNVSNVSNVRNVSVRKIGEYEVIEYTPQDISQHISEKDDTKNITPQKVGRILKTLGLETVKVKDGEKWRRYIVYNPQKLRVLARRYLLDDRKIEEKTPENERGNILDILDNRDDGAGELQPVQRAQLLEVLRCIPPGRRWRLEHRGVLRVRYEDWQAACMTLKLKRDWHPEGAKVVGDFIEIPLSLIGGEGYDQMEKGSA